MNTIETTTLFWDCECEHNYIHPKSQTGCEKCGSESEYQPDSRIDEVIRHYLPTLSPGKETEERILAKVKGETNMRTIRKDIQAIHTATKQIYVTDDQVFYETKKAWEIWTTGEFERRIARFSKSNVFFTLSVDGEAWESC